MFDQIVEQNESYLTANKYKAIELLETIKYWYMNKWGQTDSFSIVSYCLRNSNLINDHNLYILFINAYKESNEIERNRCEFWVLCV